MAAPDSGNARPVHTEVRLIDGLPIAIVRLNRPAQLNALSMATETALSAALNSELVRSARALVLTGSAVAFSAGADVTELRTLTPTDIAAYYRGSGQVYEQLARLSIPTVAAVSGHCLGGGLELALACDTRVFTDTVTLGFPEINLGILPSSGGLTRLVAAVGPAVARELILFGESVTADWALQHGLARSVVPAGTELHRALADARTLAEKPSLAFAWTNSAITAAGEASGEASRLIEQLAYAALNGGEGAGTPNAEAAAGDVEPAAPAAPPAFSGQEVPGDFDSVGPHVHKMRTTAGRTVHVADTADGGTPVLFLGGAGTSARAFGLLEFVRSLRESLGIRLISVERNGLGQTPFDPSVGFSEYAADCWSVLEQLGVDRVSVVAISGGGPYAARVIARHPERVRSLHIACAISDAHGGAVPRFNEDQIMRDPASWWAFPEHSPTHHIPGFPDRVLEEALRGRFALGRDAPADGLLQSLELLSEERFPSLAAYPGPAFTYWGLDDPLVTLEHRTRWLAALPQPATRRDYPGEGHDVQYRHWDQILADVATLGGVTVLSTDETTRLVPDAQVAAARAAGATLGVRAWRTAGA